jgi:hypothetical protein
MPLETTMLRKPNAAAACIDGKSVGKPESSAIPALSGRALRRRTTSARAIIQVGANRVAVNSPGTRESD